MDHEDESVLVGVVEFTETKITPPPLFGQQFCSGRVNPKKTNQLVSACTDGDHTSSVLHSLSLRSTVVPGGEGDSQSGLVRGGGQC